ncbi:MAG TPA: RimK family protein [Gammaproteobacteria bacterium]|nr:RimK family protein [Gammaproteobacteria bacterium]
MSRHLILIENEKDWRPHYPQYEVVTARAYLGQSLYLKAKGLRIINLCRGYRYLSLGYYCSLLAEARQHKIIPSVRAIVDLSSKAIYSLNFEDFDELIQRSFKKSAAFASGQRLELHIFFGQTQAQGLQDLARQLYDLYRCPLLKVEFDYNGKWGISSIKPAALNSLDARQEAFFIDALNSHLHQRWKRPRPRSISKYDIAVLHNPRETLPPSDTAALRKFAKAAKSLDVDVELIERKDYARLAEYDALFIRETTSINHHTYRFAKKAESEGMAVLDDPDSIVKCTNKVYLAELLAVNRIPAPRTVVLQKGSLNALEEQLAYPMVLKIPDGSFSRGVYKAADRGQIADIAAKLFRESDLILAQEFIPTEFDWRIGVLDRKPLFACRYYMSKHHWQIVKRDDKGHITQGGYKAYPIEDTPPAIVSAAVSAANLIGDGLYGVDVKETIHGPYIIEINDNPNLEAGVEDACLKDELYRILVNDFIRRIEQRKNR